MSNFSPERTHALYEWQEKDEINLLLAIQAISQESVEDYNPEINLFHRIEIILNKRFSYEAILSKIKELKQRFYKTRGLTDSNFEVKRNKLFLISKDIWGRKENNGELGSKRTLENGNVEAEDEIQDAERGYRNEMIEKEVEEGAQSGSGNETADAEDTEEDGQRGVGNEKIEVEDKEQGKQRDEIMEMEDTEKDTQRDEIREMEYMEKDTQRDFEKETMEVDDKKNEIKRGVGNEKIEMEDEEQGKQRDETWEMEYMEKNAQRDFEKETMESNDKKNEIKRGVGNEKIEMEDEEQGKQREEIREMEYMEKDTQRDFEKEMTEANDKKNEIKRGGGNEKIETEDEEQGKQSVKAVQSGVRISKAVKLNSIVSPSIKISKHAIKFRHKKKQLNVGGIGAKSNASIQLVYKVLKSRTSMQKDSNGEMLCPAGHMECGCTLENKIMEPLTVERGTIGTLKGAGFEFENLSKSKEASTASVLSKIKNRDDESKCMESNKCSKSIKVTNKRGLRTVLLEKRKQRHNLKSQPVSKKLTLLLEKRKQPQNLKSPHVNKKQTVLLEKRKQQQNLKSSPVNKKQKTGVKLYGCGNLGDSASNCVQRKVVEHPTEKQESSEGTAVRQPEATTNKAVELSKESEPIRLGPVPKEHTANKKMEEKSTISESVSYHRTFDNMIAETSGEINFETTNNKAIELSTTTKPTRSEPVPEEHRANKNLEEKATVSESGSYHHTSDNTKAETSGQFKSETTNNKAVDSSNDTKNIRSESVPKGSKTNKNFKKKYTVSGSCSYHHTTDNAKAEGAENFKTETTDKKGEELSNETELLRSEPSSKECTSNKNSEGKATISKSSSYHQTSEETGNSKVDDRNRPTLEQRKPSMNEPESNNELTAKKNLEEKSVCPSGNGKQTLEQKNTNEHSSQSPRDSTSELRRESLSNNSETGCHQSSHEHKKESSNSRHIENHCRYGQRYDEWRQYSRSHSPSVLHGRTYSNSYPLTPSRKAEDVHRFPSVSHQYSFESLSPRIHSNYDTGYATNNLRPNVSHFQGGGYHNLLMAQRAEYQYAEEQRMRERNNLNQNGYNYAYWHSYNGRDVGRYQPYATQRPPLPTEPYPYPQPSPSLPPRHTKPYWHQ